MSDFKWWHTAVFYQIYPRSFADANGDGIGDLRGIVGKLDYLKDLGVDAIWLSPHFPSPNWDWGYDVSDYMSVAPEYGTLQDFELLLSETHRRGMRLILDLVLNHTSDQHPWFQSARHSSDSPYRDWYVWADKRPGDANKGMVFPGVQKSTWTRDSESGARIEIPPQRSQKPLIISAVLLLVLVIAGAGIFCGCVGKSAQFPLHVWLPDSMEGPTPISALIHAATMVTAGVYMVARLNFVYALSPSAMGWVALIGAVTAIFSASIGFFQYDIKKVLAYSTVSQLGFMFIGVGVGAFWAGSYHLLTHAFFKACLFLGSGSVILGCHHEQDMRKMGGLKKLMPVTALAYLAACWAIAGFPWASGFFSKDEILWKAWSGGFRESGAVSPRVITFGGLSWPKTIGRPASEITSPG